MSVNTPPNPNVSTFNNLYWIDADNALTYAEASKKFLKFPIAQGAETLQKTTINGDFTVNNTILHLGTNSGATAQGANSIAIGHSAGTSQVGTTNLAIGRSAGASQAVNSNIAIGHQSGASQTASNAIAIGDLAGASQVGECIAIGKNSGASQTFSGAIAIGLNSGASQSSQAIAIGKDAGFTSQAGNSIAIGVLAGRKQGIRAIAIGQQAARDDIAGVGQGQDAVAIGTNAAYWEQGANAIAIGVNAAGSTTTAQGTNSVAIGNGAGQTFQRPLSVAVGFEAGKTNQRDYAVALGWSAGLNEQPSESVAIGSGAGIGSAGVAGVGARSVCIGRLARGTGVDSVAIGNDANTSTFTSSVALGHLATCNANNQIRLGTASENVSILGTLTSAGNINTTGTFASSFLQQIFTTNFTLASPLKNNYLLEPQAPATTTATTITIPSGSITVGTTYIFRKSVNTTANISFTFSGGFIVPYNSYTGTTTTVVLLPTQYGTAFLATATNVLFQLWVSA